MAQTQAQLRASAKYKAAKTKKILVEFYPADMELFEYIQTVGPKQTYIKNLIREDMEKKQV